MLTFRGMLLWSLRGYQGPANRHWLSERFMPRHNGGTWNRLHPTRGAVSGVSPRDLLPGAVNIHYPSALVQSGDRSVLSALAQSTGVPVKALVKRTPAGSSWRWLQEWWVGGAAPGAAPPPQLCPACLTADLQSGDHVQFLRLQWQCAAMTICPKHVMPLFEACPHCRRIN